jgi:hypothetical protein
MAASVEPMVPIVRAAAWSLFLVQRLGQNDGGQVPVAKQSTNGIADEERAADGDTNQY